MSDVRDEPQVTKSLEDRRDDGLVAYVVVNNAGRLNVLNSSLVAQLKSTLDDLRDDPRIRLAILTGAGTRAFIGGADINEMVKLNPDSARSFINGLHEACEALRKLPVPVIARISGYCLGAGLEIAASCDLRVASAGSTFGMPEVRVGIPSVIEAALLPRLVGWGKAAELIYTGNSLTAEQAAEIGLIERAVPQEHLDQAVEDWTSAILKAGPRAIRLQKKLVAEWQRLPVDEAIMRGVETFADAYRTDEPRLMMERFIARKRK